MRWSVVVPVYNEAGFLPDMLASIVAQTLPHRLIIVDNGSTDGGIMAARAQLAGRGAVRFLTEMQAGQVHALAAGLAQVDTEFVAVCDADTVYPAHYLATATQIFDRRGVDTVAACAWPRPQAGTGWSSALHRLTAHRLMPRQNHVNGGSQTFRTDILRAAGGYDAAIWPYVLKDHELMHRVLQFGHQAMARDFWCSPSPRRADRVRVRWTLAERLAYHAAPFATKQRFFHNWLAPRLAARGQTDTVLRHQPWQAA